LTSLTSTSAVLRTLLLSDLVGSTRLTEQLGDEAAAQLFHRHDAVARDLLVEHDGLEIDKTDGFLMLFKRPISAVLYALDYHRELEALSRESGVELTARVGIHLGEVVLIENPPQQVARGAKPLEVEGLAKPMAARVMSLAAGRQTLLTHSAEEMAQRAAVGLLADDRRVRWLEHGPYVFEGVEAPIDVFEVGVEGSAPLRAPADTDKARAVPRPAPARRGGGRWLGPAAAVVAAAVLAVLAWGPFLGGRATETAAAGKTDGRRMIVVLPLENLGAPEDEYFASGVTAEITSRLARINGLGVISRNSAVHYAKSTKTTQQIGAELGVDYLLEGTVRWSSRPEGAKHVRITPQLISVADDTSIWSEIYNRTFDDIFEIQSEISREVAAHLGATLLQAERAASEELPTQSLDAYRAYLRGIYYDQRPDYSVENLQREVEAFERAVELDPRFALAHAELARAHSMVHFQGHDLSRERIALARSAAERALELAPESPGVHLAVGYFHYMAELDYPRALAELAIAEEGMPGSAEILVAKGYVLRRTGSWNEALLYFERGFTLSPRDATLASELAETLQALRRYPEALRYYDLSIDLDPAQTFSRQAKARTHWLFRGDLEAARRALSSLPENRDPVSTVYWFWQEVYEGDTRGALEHLADTPDEVLEYWEGTLPTALLAAQAHALAGEAGPAREAYEAARILLEAEVERRPEDPRCHSALGLAYAGLGRPAEAVRQGRRAVELYPISRDAPSGIPYVVDLALIYTKVGDQDAAIDQLRELLSMPAPISSTLLELDPRWAPLRRHPRFHELPTDPGG
jgi:serine/threonine-protein kinase